MAKPKLRHLALFARDPEKLAQFYVDVFEMTVVPDSDGSAARYVTDGHVTLAILPHRLQGSAPRGLNHFGFAVEDTAAISARIAKYDVESPKERPADRPFAEYRAVDPEGNWFDLSEHGFDTVETGEDRASAASRR
jgi:catechol 2,3-dioxygenase-like lactoylglutathione lyase family enzyme